MAKNSIKIQNIRTNDVNQNTGKQVEFGKGWCEFLGVPETAPEESIELTFKSLTPSHLSYDNKKIILRMDAVTSRGDRKLYANGKNGYSQLKEFFITDLGLTSNNTCDYFAIYKNSTGQFFLFFVPALLYKNFIHLFESIDISYSKETSTHSSIESDFPLQQIWYGAPGTGKSHEVNELTGGMDNKNVFRTTFHPDSDYSTFVGCYKPQKELVVLRDMAGRPVHDPISDEEIKEERITYRFEPQAFVKAYVRAYQTDEPVVLVIEEINRGNCAQIFGDIFQLLDRKDGVSEYPVKPDSSLNDYLKEVLGDKYDEDRGMVIPSNLHIWATMNTSDQSLFPIDSAFKRRWDWKYVPINTRKDDWSIEVGGEEYSWSIFLENVNKEIFEATNSEDKQLGFYFCKATAGVIGAERFVNKVLFYLYNDVFKDYGLDRNFLHDAAGEVIPFKDFFTMDGNVNSEKVKTILKNLEVSVQNEESPADEV